MYEGFPSLKMQFSTKVSLYLYPIGILALNILKNKNVAMIIQKTCHPGFFELKAKKGDIIVFSASTKRKRHQVLNKSLRRMNQVKSHATVLLIVKKCCSAIC